MYQDIQHSYFVFGSFFFSDVISWNIVVSEVYIILLFIVLWPRTSIFVIFGIMFCSVISKLPISDYLVATKLSFKNDGMRSYKVQYFDIVLVLLGSIFYNRSIIYIHQTFLKVVVHVIIIDH